MPKKNDIKDFEESIKNYGNQIKQMNFTESVRHHPGMYIGYKGNEGWKGCVREIWQNAFDEAVRTDSPCNYVRITYDERNQSALVEDTGRGIPHGKMYKIYGEEHTSSHYENKAGSQYSSGVNGVGSGVAMALSENFKSTSYVLGVAHEIEFHKGQLVTKEHKVDCPKDRQGTTVYLEPDLDIMGPINLTCHEIFVMVANIVPLLPIGTTVDFIGIDTVGNVCINQKLVNTDGIFTFLNQRTQNALINPITFACNMEMMKAEAAFTYDSSDLTSAEEIISFANYTNTTGGGTHVKGFLDGLCNWLRNYMNKIYLGEKSKITVVNNDIKAGLKAVISVAHVNPVFVGQFKGILSNTDMEDFVKRLTMSAMDNWSKTSPGELQKLCKFIKEVAEIRSKSETEKVKLSDKYTKSGITGLPKDYVQASGHKNLELFIVEGKSAKGPAVSGRDYHFQAVYPIRGKLPNAYKEGRAKFLSNPEVAGIINIIGAGYGREFNIDKCKFDKIIIFADADADGSHIATLVLRFVLLYMPGLIEAGRLYKAVPPLYGVKTGRSVKYFTSTVDYTKYIQGLFLNKYSFTDIKGRKITYGQATGIFYRNRNYVRDVEIVSDTYAIDPDLLENVLYELAPYIELGSSELVCNMAAKKQAVKATKKKKATSKKTKETVKKAKATGKVVVDEESLEDDEEETLLPVTETSVLQNVNYFIRPEFNFKTMAKNLKKKYQFLEVERVNDIILLKGLVNSRSQYVFLNDKFITSCIDLIMTIKSNDEYYMVDGNVVSIYGLMKAFDSVAPTGITRYKGLGEQNADQLKESAMDPNGARTLIRYTMESAKEEIESIRHTETNMYALLRELKVDRSEVE